MIVDCHTHISFNEMSSGPAEHIKAAESVDKCIVLAPAGPTGQVNQQLSDYVARFKEKMTGFAFVDPTQELMSPRRLSSITDRLGLAGAVFYCADCGFHPANSSALTFYESAQELGLPVFFHNGPDLSDNSVLEYVQPVLLDEIARKFPALKIIIGDMGTPFVEQTLEMAARHNNVYADLSINAESPWQTYNTVVAAWERKVLDKLLFGSGFPRGRAERSIEMLLGFNRLIGNPHLPTVPREKIQDIIERNTLDLLGIEKK